MAETIRKHGMHLLLVAALVIGLDQFSKWYMLTDVGIGARPPIDVTSFFRLVMVWNQGVSFGMLTHDTSYMRWFLVAMSIVICAIMARFGLKSNLGAERIGYGMVIGGALGNVVDRVRFGAVADFFYFHLGDLGWPAFNVADTAICLGVALLLWMMTFHPNKP